MSLDESSLDGGQGNWPWHPVIGVTRDWLLDAKSARPLPTAFWPTSPSLNCLQIIERTDAGASIIPLLRNAVENGTLRGD